MKLELETLSISGQLNKYNYSEDRKSFCINAEGLVRSPWMQRELGLIGFLPYSISSTLTPLNRPFIFTPYLLKYDAYDKPFLIYKTAKCAKGNNYPLRIGTEFVSIFDNFPSSLFNRNKDGEVSIAGNELNSLVKKYRAKVLKDVMERFALQDDNEYSYIGRDFEWELNRGGITCICRDFLCLCAYMNDVTGNISYVLLPSSDIYRIAQDE